MNPQDLRYTKEHEWVRLDGDVAVVGITSYAQEQLGDIVYVDLPETGKALKQMETFGAVDSVKTASDLYAPLSGKVIEGNERSRHPAAGDSEHMGRVDAQVRRPTQGARDALDAAGTSNISRRSSISSAFHRHMPSFVPTTPRGATRCCARSASSPRSAFAASRRSSASRDDVPAARVSWRCSAKFARSPRELDMDHYPSFLGAGAYGHFTPSTSATW